MTKLDPADVAWSRNHFRIMREGAAWAVPRSGLIFVKRGKSLVLTTRMPHDPAMPINAKKLRKQQQADFDIIKLNFEAAGIAVTDLSGREERQ